MFFSPLKMTFWAKKCPDTGTELISIVTSLVVSMLERKGNALLLSALSSFIFP